MSDSMFQKENNDEINVHDMSVNNPCLERLLMRPSDTGQVFYAKVGWVLKCVYTDLDSLAAFGADTVVSYYAIYSRESHGQDVLFIEHEESRGNENLEMVSFDELKEEAQELVPQDLRP